MSCNSRCWYSTSKKCECSCGGKNHGQGMKGEEMVRVEKAFPPCTPVRFGLFNKKGFGRSLGRTFLFEGEIRLEVAAYGVQYALPLDELEKIDEIDV